MKLVIETGLGTTAEACRALGLARSSYYHNSTMSHQSRGFQKQIVSLSQDYPRYGYRRVTALLRREGHEIQRQASAASAKKGRLTSQPTATKVAPAGAFDGGAATGAAS